MLWETYQKSLKLCLAKIWYSIFRFLTLNFTLSKISTYTVFVFISPLTKVWPFIWTIFNLPWKVKSSQTDRLKKDKSDQKSSYELLPVAQMRYIVIIYIHDKIIRSSISGCNLMKSFSISEMKHPMDSRSLLYINWRDEYVKELLLRTWWTPLLQF